MERGEERKQDAMEAGAEQQWSLSGGLSLPCRDTGYSSQVSWVGVRRLDLTFPWSGIGCRPPWEDPR